MPQAGRIRVRSLAGEVGYRDWYFFGNPPPVSHEPIGTSALYERCEDNVGFRDQDNGFLHTRATYNPGRINGIYYAGFYDLHYNNVPLAMPHFQHAAIAPSPNPDLDITRAMAYTNPSKPNVSLPTFIGELRDLPKMLQHEWEGLLKKHPGKSKPLRKRDISPLEWTFGWAPLISDVSKLLRVQELAARRFSELKTLRDRGWIGRRFGVRSISQTEISPNEYFWYSWGHTIGTVILNTTYREWYSIRWVAEFGGDPPLNDAQLMDKAKSTVLGLGVRDPATSLQTAYNLMPWTWLADWYFNADEFIGANLNSVGASAVSGCHMEERKTSYSMVITDNDFSPPPSLSSGHLVDHSRLPVTIVSSLQARAPILSGEQVSILGSIGSGRSGAKL
jgi:hypothetical protein